MRLGVASLGIKSHQEIRYRTVTVIKCAGAKLLTAYLSQAIKIDLTACTFMKVSGHQTAGKAQTIKLPIHITIQV